MVSLLSLESLGSFWAAPEVHANIIVFFNLIGALFLGLIVGYERTYRGRAAGMRTYGLVCMASAALTVVSGYSAYWFGGHAGNMGPVDPTRIIQGIVTGIGFLGAGIIMKDGRTISGLTTAASIWASSAIGILIGIGLYLSAILLTMMSVIFMMWGLRIESWLPSRPAVSIMLRFQKGHVATEKAVHDLLISFGYEIARGTVAIMQLGGQTEWRFIGVSLGRKQGASMIDLSNALGTLEGIENFQVCQARN